jgi:hypothetical protein
MSVFANFFSIIVFQTSIKHHRRRTHPGRDFEARCGFGSADTV